MDEIKTKICTGCSEEKLISEFGKNNSGKYGVNSKCKECINELSFKNKISKLDFDEQLKRINQRNKNKKLKQLKNNCKKEHAICHTCLKEKPLTNEYFGKNHRTKSSFDNICKECIKEYRQKSKSLYSYTVYVHINKINNKLYIGSTGEKVGYRWKNGDGYKGQIFGNAVDKYGWENFEHEVVASRLTKEEAENFENLLIYKLKTRKSNRGYNVTCTYNDKWVGFNKNKKQTSQAKRVTCDGNTFDSIRDCAKYYNVSRDKIQDWLNRKCAVPQKFVDMKLSYFGEEPVKEVQQKGKRGKNSNAKKIICDGEIFECVKDCAEFYDIGYERMINWLKGKHKTPQRYIDLGLRYFNPEVDGDIEQYEKVN